MLLKMRFQDMLIDAADCSSRRLPKMREAIVALTQIDGWSQFCANSYPGLPFDDIEKMLKGARRILGRKSWNAPAELRALPADMLAFLRKDRSSNDLDVM